VLFKQFVVIKNIRSLGNWKEARFVASNVIFKKELL